MGFLFLSKDLAGVVACSAGWSGVVCSTCTAIIVGATAAAHHYSAGQNCAQNSQNCKTVHPIGHLDLLKRDFVAVCWANIGPLNLWPVHYLSEGSR
jgi:hypothetical protein